MFNIINIRPQLHHQKWRKLRVTLPPNMAPFSKEDSRDFEVCMNV